MKYKSLIIIALIINPLEILLLGIYYVRLAVQQFHITERRLAFGASLLMSELFEEATELKFVSNELAKSMKVFKL